jgi:peptidoglycan/LPS O-acetylase OafA/YrhL
VQNSQFPYRPDVDGLRAISVIAIVSFHFKLFGLTSGYLGVDVFLVISGFLIAGTYLNDMRSFPQMGRFYQRRVARILPMASATYLAVLLIARIQNGPVFDHVFTASAQAASLFVSNVYFWNHGSYFQPLRELNPLIHTWSLSVEEQFYLIVPFLLIAGRRPVWLFGALALLSLFSMYFTSSDDAAFFLIPNRAWEFSVGALIAVGSIKTKKKEASFIVCTGLAILFYIFIAPQAELRETLFPRLLAVTAAALILIGGLDPNIWSENFLGNRWMTALGKTSFVVYLIHWPIYVAAYELAPRNFAPIYSYALAALTFLISVPLHRGFEAWSRRRIREMGLRAALFTSGLLIFIPFVIATVFQLRSEKLRESNDYLAKIKIAGPAPTQIRPHGHGECFIINASAKEQFDWDACVPPLSSLKRVLIIGDSFASDRTYGLEKLAGERLNIFQATVATCPPLIVDSPGLCQKNMEFIFNEVVPKSHVDLVIIGARWNRDFEKYGEEKFRSVVAKTLKSLKKRAPRVLLIGASPMSASQSVVTSIANYVLKTETIPDRLYLPEKTHRDINKVLLDIAEKSDVTFFDPTTVLCEKEECLVTLNGEPLYFDYGHMTKTGSEFAAHAVIDVIDKILK